MKAAYLRPLVLLITFGIGVTLTGLIHVRKAVRAEQACAKVPTPEGALPPCAGADYSLLSTVTYCDLMAAPESYENKWVLIRFYVHGMLRRDDICIKGDPHFKAQVVPLDLATAKQEGWGEKLLFNGKTLTLVARFRRSLTPADPANQNQFELLAAHGVITDGIID
ncbi:MAG TPA: hypothetical protein VGD61_04900 [Pyrinomonadaceae bacterium]